MRHLFVAAALLVSAASYSHPAEARYFRYVCLSSYYNVGVHHGFYACSAWYSPGVTPDQDAVNEASADALKACGDDSAGIQCSAAACAKETTDEYSPSWACPEPVVW